MAIPFFVKIPAETGPDTGHGSILILLSTARTSYLRGRSSHLPHWEKNMEYTNSRPFSWISYISSSTCSLRQIHLGFAPALSPSSRVLSLREPSAPSMPPDLFPRAYF